MLKKQTVWLLTMLSLLVVLSVFYIMSPNDDLTLVNQGNDEDKGVIPTESTTEDTSEAEVTDITNVSSDDLFTLIRLEVQDDRSRETSRLESIVSSSTATIEEKDSALKGIDEIETIKMKEKILEQSIVSEAGYEDVLVRNSDGDKVHVHVLVDELSDQEALRIMQMVRDEFNRDITVEVNYQSASAK